ncbi:MAG: MBL fold metallo-hydrolase [Lachnospiraceae bacterium]|nr:MBL fold metallo-hydrolase [Lachnospiraceae bacterium]
MGIKTPYVSEIAKNTYAINEFGLTAMYLLVGDESALLIDTGCGACDLKGLVARLTDKSYRVVLTHGHLDHAGGIGAFDEVYLGEGDFEMAADIDTEELRNYLDTLGNMGGYDVYDYTRDNVQKPTKLPNMIGIHDGDRFELGNRSVLAIEVPGHTKGGICFLDEKTQIMFSGDACNCNLLVMGTSVNTALRGLDYLKTYDGRYQQMYNGHIGYAGIPTCLSLPESTLDDCIHIMETILDGTAVIEKVPFLGGENTCASYGTSRVSFDPERLIDEGETPRKL